MKVETNLPEQLKDLTQICQKLEEFENKVQKLMFLTIKETEKLTGWSNKTVQNLFNRPDFPSCDFGKEKIVEVNAMRNYFSVPRRRN